MSYLSRSMKKVGRSVGRSNPAAIARQVMSHAQIKKHILKEVGKVLQRDIKRACQIKINRRYVCVLFHGLACWEN